MVHLVSQIPVFKHFQEEEHCFISTTTNGVKGTGCITKVRQEKIIHRNIPVRRTNPYKLSSINIGCYDVK